MYFVVTGAFSLLCFSFLFFLCVILYIREVEETYDWGEKEIDRNKKKKESGREKERERLKIIG